MTDTKSMLTSLSWTARLTIIERYDLTDAEAVTNFGVSLEELNMAKEFKQDDVFKIDPTLEVEQYSAVLVRDSIINPKSQKSPTTSESETTGKKPHKATSAIKNPSKKVGHKGTKIAAAFTAIGLDPISVDTLMSQTGVSLAVLRQANRFDKTGGGPVRVRKDKTTGALMVWRE